MYIYVYNMYEFIYSFPKHLFFRLELSSWVFSNKSWVCQPETPVFQAPQEPVGLSQPRCFQELNGGGNLRMEEGTFSFENKNIWHPFSFKMIRNLIFCSTFVCFFDGFWKGLCFVGFDPWVHVIFVWPEVHRLEDLTDFTQGEDIDRLAFFWLIACWDHSLYRHEAALHNYSHSCQRKFSWETSDIRMRSQLNSSVKSQLSQVIAQSSHSSVK